VSNNKDIVERLNQSWYAAGTEDASFLTVSYREWVECTGLTREAAAEIERLRKELNNRIHMCDIRSEKILELTAERDEARQMFCKCHAQAEAIGYAEGRGWNCFKEDGNA